MIGGFIIEGSTPKTVLVRARGPTLAGFGVPGVLANPFLQLFSGQTVVASNDNWQDTQAAEIMATGLAPSSTLESAILMTLGPGVYTAIVSGIGGKTGIALVEVFEVEGIAPSGCPTDGAITDLQRVCSNVAYLYLSPDGTMMASLVTRGSDILTSLAPGEENPDVLFLPGTVLSSTNCSSESGYTNDPANGIVSLDLGSGGNIAANGNILNQTIILSASVFSFDGYLFLTARILAGGATEEAIGESLSAVLPQVRAQIRGIYPVDRSDEMLLRELRDLLR